MAHINVPVTSVNGITPVDGKYWFVARFYVTSTGLLSTDPKYPQNQLVNTVGTTPLPQYVSVEVAEDDYTISDITLRLFNITDLPGGSINLGTLPVDCDLECINPTYGAITLTEPTCTNGATNYIGSVSIASVANYNRYRLFLGAPTVGGYNGATSSVSSTVSFFINFPQSIIDSPYNYTLRLYNNDDLCFTDIPLEIEWFYCPDICCSGVFDSVEVDGDPGPINCDLVQTDNPVYQLSGPNKQVRVFLFSAVSNIGPFRYRIYDASNNLIQTIYPISNADVFVNINNTIPSGTYRVDVEDSRGCFSDRRNFVISGSIDPVTTCTSQDYEHGYTPGTTHTYTINVTSGAGTYTVAVNYGRWDPGASSGIMTVNGGTPFTMALPNTGSPGTFQNYTFSATLVDGNNTFKVDGNGGYWRLRRVCVTGGGSLPPDPDEGDLEGSVYITG